MNRFLAAFVLIWGIVRMPLHAVAAMLPILIAYDAAVRPTATTRVEMGPSLRRERGASEYDYDAVRVGWDSATNPHLPHRS
jgi:hypothetical protein